MNRKSETPAMVRRIMCRQGVIPCCLCGKRLKPEDKLVREHLHALALDGADEEENMGFAHAECAQKKTTGRKHMSDGDSHLITKSRRLAKPKKPGKKKWPSKPIPKHNTPWGKKDRHGPPA